MPNVFKVETQISYTDLKKLRQLFKTSEETIVSTTYSKKTQTFLHKLQNKGFVMIVGIDWSNQDEIQGLTEVGKKVI